jgi:hypothetical protein
MVCAMINYREMSKESLLLGFTEAKISALTLLELLITAFLYQTVTIP